MSRIYSIYHIPKFVYKDGSIGKIGVTYQAIEDRINQNLNKSLKGFEDWEVLEEHTDVYEVSDREIELQKEYGYPVDKVPYWKTIKMPTKEGTIKGGKISGKKHVESGQMKRMTKLSNAARKRPILQYDLDNNFIREWESQTQVARELGFNLGNINSVLNGRLKKSYEFIWKYKK